jgi:putative tryptophan/tyrosine transport system substrate-binding protein
VKRREFITLLGGGAIVGWPLAARGQQSGKVLRIGFLSGASPTAAGFPNRIAGLRSGLRDLGYVEGANFVIEYRWAEENYTRLPGLAADLIRSNVDVIVTHGTPAVLAAKRVTATVPIVMAIIGDPIASGVVTSVARPGGNITGSSFFGPEVHAKRIELLKEAMPQLTRTAVLLNLDNPFQMGAALQAMQIVAQSLKLQLKTFPVRASTELERTFDDMQREHVEAILVADDAVIFGYLDAIAAFANSRRLLSIGSRELVQAGGIIGYGIDYPAAFRRAAIFVDKILRGSKPGDIPIEQATKFEIVLNLKAAKTLGFEVPTPILLRADEVIE